MLDRIKIAGVLIILLSAAAVCKVFGGEKQEVSLKAEFMDGEQSCYIAHERELRITLLREGAERGQVICRAEGTDGKEKWDAGTIDWFSDTEGRIIFQREGWYRLSVEYGSESYPLPEFCLETTRPEKPEADTGSYKQGTWTNRPVHINLSKGSSFSGLSYFEYTESGEDEWKKAEGDRITIRANGIHSCKVRSVSKAGNRSSAADISVNFWNRQLEKPKVSCGNPGAGGWYQKDAEICAEEKKSRGPKITTFISVKNLDTGSRKIVKENRLTLSGEGKYQISVRQKDEAGNTSKKAWKKKVCMDAAKPIINFNGEPERKYNKDTSRLEVTIKDSYLDAESIRWQTTGKVTNQRVKGGVLKAEILFENEGEQKLSVTCRDQAGNFTESSAGHFFIDKTRPKLKIMGISSLGIYRFAVDPKVVCTDDAPTAVSLYLNGKLLKTEKGQPGETIRAAYPRLSEDGYYCAEVRARDSAGNESSETISFTVSCKGTQIVPGGNTVQKSSSGKEQGSFGFQMKNVVPSYVTEFLVNGRTVPYKKKGDYIYVSKEYLKNGSNEVKVKMKDMTGHVSMLNKPFVFHYDAEPPVILVSGVRNGNTYLEKKQIQVKVQDKQDHLTGLWLDNQRIDVSGEQAVIRCRTDGNHRLEIEAAGSSGLKSSKAVEFKINTKHVGRTEWRLKSAVTGIYFLTAVYLIFFFFRIRKSKETS